MHKSKLTAKIALLLAACLCLASCSRSQSDTENTAILLPEPETSAAVQFIGESISPSSIDATLHYASDGSLSLGTMVRRIPLAQNESAIAAILDELMSTAALSGAAEADLLNIESGSGVVTVNLSIAAGVNRSQQDYLLLCASIANTLLELDGVNAVNVLTGGRSDSLCSLPLGVFTEKQDNIAAIYAQIQSESERFPSGGSTALERNALLYFPADGANYLLPEVRQLSFTDGDYASAIIEALSAGPLVRSCSFTAIPSNMNLQDKPAQVSVTTSGERIIELSFDPALTSYLAFSGVHPWQLYGSLTLSLCSFVPETDAVRIRLGEETVTQCDLNGRLLTFEQGLMRRQDFADAVGSSSALYFTDDGEALIRAEKSMSQSASASPLHLLQQLIAAEAPEGLASVFPEGIEEKDILGVSIEDKTAAVNLSANFYARCQNLTASEERLLIYCMVNTLAQLPPISAVAFRVEGRQVSTLAQNIYLKTPLLPDYGLVSSAQS